ncbi:SpoIID/LytB domain-containing protein [Caloramator sp. ALD01]|uniref:SpoIID/LytB domain-containing protein n=1 Tax=Caloramator sp. ALD01 TaxID=1031288 RepID=UPI00041628F5|nr:SpoIID/LytB domain-containing protein [Caloramator sp. ALD01]
MQKKLISIFILLTFLLNNALVFAAVSPELYYTKLRVYLDTMKSNQMQLTLNGDYVLKLKNVDSAGQEVEVFKEILPQNSQIKLELQNGKIAYSKYLKDDKDNKYKFIYQNSTSIVELEPILEESSVTICSIATRTYLGDFRFFISGTNIVPINKIEIEKYLVGVVPYEIGFGVPLEAYKAQAVAARTYALNNIKPKSSFDLYDSESSQVYRGLPLGKYELPHKENIEKAIRETKGEVITYNGSLVSTYFSASNGGYTEKSVNVWTSDLPYLLSRYDEFDDPNVATNLKKFTWVKTFKSDDIEQRMLSNGLLLQNHKFNKIFIENELVERFESERIKALVLECYVVLKDSGLQDTSDDLVDINIEKQNNEDVYNFIYKNSTKKLKASEIDSILRNKGVLKSNDKFDRIDIIKDSNGNVVDFRVVYTKKLDKTTSRSFLNKKVDGKTVDSPLLSSLYYISYDQENDIYKFSGKGYGHGVGMSQYGAINRANAGQSYRDILAFYYPKTNIVNMDAVLKSVEIDYSEVLVGQPVNIKVNTYNTNNKYSYIIQNNTEEIAKFEDSDSEVFTFTPKTVGNYKVLIDIKQKDIEEESSINTSINFKVYDVPKINSISSTVQKIYENKTATFNVDAVNGTSKGKIYYFEVLKDGKVLSSRNQESKTFSFTPTVIGEYVLKVRVKDKTSRNDFDDEKEIKFTVEREPLVLVYKRPLKLGTTGEDVKMLQEALKRLGYYKSTTTTYYGIATRDSVKAFQRVNGLKVDGMVGPQTINKINSMLQRSSQSSNVSRGSMNIQTPINKSLQLTYKRPLKLGTTGEDVKMLQEALKRLGYFKLTTTTYYGTATRDAVNAFQRANGLKVDGMVGPQTINKINNKLK